MNDRFNDYLLTAYSYGLALVPNITSENIFILVTFFDKLSPIAPKWIDEIIMSFKDAGYEVRKENFIIYDHRK